MSGTYFGFRVKFLEQYSNVFVLPKVFFFHKSTYIAFHIQISRERIAGICLLPYVQPKWGG